MTWTKQLILTIGLALSLFMVSPALADSGTGFSPLCGTPDLGEETVILVMTDSGLQALQTLSDCESVLAKPPGPTSLQLVSVQTNAGPDQVMVWGFAFVAVSFVTLLVLWSILVRPGRQKH
jgi:hypothetical protein